MSCCLLWYSCSDAEGSHAAHGKKERDDETYRNEEQMQCLAKSEGCSTLPVSLYLADRVSITGAQAALAVMLSMSLVGSLAKLEVFFQNTRQMKMTAE